MKKYSLLMIMLFIPVLVLKAQHPAESIPPAKAASISLALADPQNYSGADRGTLPLVQALYDIQFTSFLDSTVSALSAFAGVAWTGSEWWVSKWNKDSIFTLSPTGGFILGFKIPGVGASNSGVRSMTYDGTYLYMADNTFTIKKVDPVTKTLVGTINVPSTFTARTISYSPISNGGAGGFWISNFGSPLLEIDTAGNLLNSVPLATHTLVGVYGLAVDTLSFGGPYLWAFDQTSTGKAAKLVRLSLPACTPTFVNHDVNSDVGLLTPTGAIAGGLFITDSFVPGKFTLAGVLQDTTSDILFAYELDSTSQAPYEASLDTFRWQPPYTIVPDQQLSTFTFPAIASNNGSNVISTLTYNVTVSKNGTQVYTGSGAANNIAPGGYALISPSGNYLPAGIGNYNVFGQIAIAGPPDPDSSNDTLSFLLSVSDTVMARDNGVVNGALGIANSLGGVLGQTFTLPAADQITSITFRCNGPTAGDTTRAVVYSMSGGLPASRIGQSAYYFFDVNDTNGVLLTLEIRDLSGNVLNVGPGTYYIGIEEHFKNVSLATSNFNWRQSETFISWPGQPWASNEDFGFKRIFFLRMNTGNSITGIQNEALRTEMKVYPNPAGELIFVEVGAGMRNIELQDASGRLLQRNSFTGPVFSDKFYVGNLAAGLYQLRIESQDGHLMIGRFIKD